MEIMIVLMVPMNLLTNVEVLMEPGLVLCLKFRVPLMAPRAEQINFNVTMGSAFQAIYNARENRNVMMNQTKSNAVSIFLLSTLWINF